MLHSFQAPLTFNAAWDISGAKGHVWLEVVAQLARTDSWGLTEGGGGRAALSWRCERMRSTTLGSAITARSFISAPQLGQSSGSTSKILRSRRAQEARLAELQ